MRTAERLTDEVIEQLQRISHTYTNQDGDRWNEDAIRFAVFGTLVAYKEEN